LKLDQLDNSTQVSVTWDEFQRPDTPALYVGITKAVGFLDTVFESIETGIAQAQVHFDPSLKVKELLAEGNRGTANDVFYSGNRSSILIDAPPERVAKYIASPEAWASWSQKYNVDFGKCWAAQDHLPCPVKFNSPGIELTGTAFTTSYEFPAYLSSYWVFPDYRLTCWMSVFVKPVAGKTQLTFDLAVEPSPAINSPELVNFLIGSDGILKTFDLMLLDTKAALEAQ
jgi:hypothetical protein